MNLFNYFIIFILKLIYIQDVSQNVISSGHFVVSRYVKILSKRDEFAKYQKKHSISAEPKKHLKNNNLNLLKYNCHLHKCIEPGKYYFEHSLNEGKGYSFDVLLVQMAKTYLP